jgi:GxxExxY protein
MNDTPKTKFAPLSEQLNKISGIIVEIKSSKKIIIVHEIQLITYLKITGLRLGLIINFNTPLIKNGIKRIIR